jgi:hypothetical protein
MDELKFILKNFFKLFCHMRIDDPGAFFFINRNLDLLVELDPETFEKNIWSVKKSLANLIVDAQKAKLLKKDLDPQMTATTLFSSLGHLLRDENISCKFSGFSVFDEEYRNKYINHVINCYIDGAKESI